MSKDLVIFMPSIEGGGVEKNLFLIANFLSKKIEKVSLITISKNFKNKFPKKIKFISLKLNFWNSLGRRKKFVLALMLLFVEIVKRKRKVLVLCFQGNIYCTLLCKILGIKIIVRSNSAPDGWSQNIFKFYFFKYIFKFADKIVVNSIDFKKKFKQKFNLNVDYIYNPLNIQEIKKKSIEQSKFKYPDKKLKIINIARFTDQKDQITILKALRILKNKVNFFMYIMGRGVEEQNLKNCIEKYKLSKNVKLIKFQNNPYSLLKKSNLFILSSIYEGLPNVLLEAISLKKFVISSNCPTGPREILSNGKGGLLFKPRDYNKLSKLIYLYSKNMQGYKEKTNYAYNSLNRFDFKKNLNKYLNLINSLIDN